MFFSVQLHASYVIACLIKVSRQDRIKAQPFSQCMPEKMPLINANARAQILWTKCLWFGHEQNWLKIKTKFWHTNL